MLHHRQASSLSRPRQSTNSKSTFNIFFRLQHFSPSCSQRQIDPAMLRSRPEPNIIPICPKKINAERNFQPNIQQTWKTKKSTFQDTCSRNSGCGSQPCGPWSAAETQHGFTWPELATSCGKSTSNKKCEIGNGGSDRMKKGARPAFQTSSTNIPRNPLKQLWDGCGLLIYYQSIQCCNLGPGLVLDLWALGKADQPVKPGCHLQAINNTKKILLAEKH